MSHKFDDDMHAPTQNCSIAKPRPIRYWCSRESQIDFEMTTDLGSHERQFTGRGGAGNFVIKNPIPTENLPKQYSAKPVGGNATGRG